MSRNQHKWQVGGEPEKKMETKKIVMGVLIKAILCIGAASAYDASNPFTCDIRWVVPSDTTFSVSWPGGESSVDFDDNLTAVTQSGVQPDSQNNATNTPIINITNDGNQALNFTCNLTTAKPAWAVIKVNNETSYTGATAFDTTAVIVNASVAVGETTDMYLWTDVTSATPGTTERTLQINSVAA